ncbi:MAG: hypothetical protein RR770_00640 [Bacteroidales bacterium]
MPPDKIANTAITNKKLVKTKPVSISFNVDAVGSTATDAFTGSPEANIYETTHKTTTIPTFIIELFAPFPVLKNRGKQAALKRQMTIRTIDQLRANDTIPSENPVP